MTSADLIEKFERGETVTPSFHHADHIRVAFAYVSELPILLAVEKFSAALKRYALAQGKPNLYHETITWAYLFLIHERIARGDGVQDWEQFAEQNPDLLQWKPSILERLYSGRVLDSDLARRPFVFPDASH